MLDGHLAVFSEHLQIALGTVFGLLVLYGTKAGLLTWKENLRGVVGTVVALVLAIGCLLAPEPSVRLLAPVLILLSRVSLRGTQVSRIEWAVLLGCTLFAFGGILLGIVPRVWLTLNHLAGASTERITGMLGGNMRFGMSAIPLGTAVLITMIHLSIFPKGWKQLRLVLPIQFLVLITSIITMGLLTEDGTLTVDMAWIVCLTMSGVGTLVLLLNGWWSLTQLETQEEPTAKSGLVLGGVAVLLVVALVGTSVPFPSDPRPGEIMMVTAPADFDPVGAYRAIPPQPQPLHEVGLFGELPQVIQKLGYPVRVQIGMPTAEQLIDVRVVILFAPSATWATQQSSLIALQQFVIDGGSLLVFAEHTNYQMSGSMLTHLLAPFGIAVNFDTTNGGVGEDLRGVRLWRSEIREALRDLAAFPYNRGASLTLSGDAHPILVGRFWQGDTGNFFAEDQAFLGDFRLSPGDSFGDVILAAEWQGAAGGRVMVFGDTTPFANTALGYTSPLLIPLIQALSLPGTSPSWVRGGIAGLVVAVGLAFMRRYKPTVRVSILLVLVAGLCILLGFSETRRPSRIPETVPTLIVATNVLNQLDLNVYGDRSPTALMVEGLREGLVPAAMSLEDVGPEPPQVLLLSSPRRALSSREVAHLFRWVEEGTTVIVAADGNIPSARVVIHQLGLTFGSVPLGAITVDLPGGVVLQFHSAWPLILTDGWTALIENRQLPVVVQRRLGKGRLIVIGDEGLSLNIGLATEWVVVPSNLAWWRTLLRREADVRP
ncbi:hypothetical protein AYO43_09590 [Nitrospira sp. SCGC AG-212-E16]|nr:hypothetical protein AYO43_09590 [Nitrospira sp. SCGC AG-212-E16]